MSWDDREVGEEEQEIDRWQKTSESSAEVSESDRK